MVTYDVLSDEIATLVDGLEAQGWCSKTMLCVLIMSCVIQYLATALQFIHALIRRNGK